MRVGIWVAAVAVLLAAGRLDAVGGPGERGPLANGNNRGRYKVRGASNVESMMSLWSEREHCEFVDRKDEWRKERVVVALASDATDLVPAVAVINSTATHSRNASIVAFTTRKREMLRVLRRLRNRLPSDVRLRVCDGLEEVLKRRPALLALQGLAARNPNATARVRRQELLSPFNFAAFYLPHVLRETQEILYLDTDVVVRGDVAAAFPLVAQPGGRGAKAVAAVEDCSQRLGKYVNFPLLRKFLQKGPIGDLTEDRFPPPEKAPEKAPGGAVAAGAVGGGLRHRAAAARRRRLLSEMPALSAHQGRTRKNLAPPDGPRAPVVEDTCVFNRGVVAFHCERWRQRGLSRTIEELIHWYVRSKARLWRGGVSQPPFLVALAGRYKKLPLEWNVRGLGRVDIGRTELANMERYLAAKRPAANSSYVALRERVGTIAHFDKFSPFIAPLSYRALVLHFTGEVKPWRIAPAAAAAPDAHGVTVDPAGHVTNDCRLKRWGIQKRHSENMTSVTEYFASGCFAKLPLCATRDVRASSAECGGHGRKPCVVACAHIWHAYVNEDARRIVLSASLHVGQEDPGDGPSRTLTDVTTLDSLDGDRRRRRPAV